MKTFFKILFFLTILLLILSYGIFVYFKNNFSWEKILQNNFAQEQVSKILTNDSDSDLFATAANFLGFTETKKYLVLFLNDTEIRPAGGFIGSYAVISVDKGKINLLKLEGSESLDKNSPEDWRPAPPEILKKELGVEKWYFRDANWSPDFSVSAKKVLELYKGEGGFEAENIDAVVAVDTKVLEEILNLTGEIEVSDLKFNSKNVVEKLEYEVEYAFLEKGYDFSQRKNILKDLADKVLAEVKVDIFFHWQDYKNLLDKMIREKHISAYFVDQNLSDSLKNFPEYDNLFGKIINTKNDEDYLLWVDANLAALKTDWAIKRSLNYKIEKNSDGHYIAKAKMTYIHNGSFDWRTTRYRTYARIYVPFGAKLLAINSQSDLKQLKYDFGEELEKTYFAYFFVIEPGKTETLEFVYQLPESIEKKIENSEYTLFVQKQIGIIESGLTLDLNFDKNIVSAEPSELEKNWNDNKYFLTENLLTDKKIDIKLAK
ncbi:MAG: DUF4012 domain-containing protein [Patescibacteria group bacterium]